MYMNEYPPSSFVFLFHLYQHTLLYGSLSSIYDSIDQFCLVLCRPVEVNSWREDHADDE